MSGGRLRARFPQLTRATHTPSPSLLRRYSPPPLVAEKQEQLDLALSFVEKGIALSPTALGFLLRAKVLLRSPNREQEALGSLKKCAAANPSGAVKEACLEETVGCLLRLGETMEALATAKLTRGGPSGALAGIVYSHMQGRYAGKAVDLLTRSVKAGEVGLNALVLAQVHIAQGDAEAAAAVLRACLGAGGMDAYVHTKLGVCCAMAGAEQESLTYYHSALAIETDCAEAKEGLECLERGEGEGGDDEDDSMGDDEEDAME